MDPCHLLRKRLKWAISTTRESTRLSRWALATPKIELIDPLINAPWANAENWCAGIRRVTKPPFPLPGGIPPQDLIAFSDASCTDSDGGLKVGGGFVIYQAGKLVSRKCIPLSPNC